MHSEIEPTLEERLAEAEKRVRQHVDFMKRRENEYATERELSALRHEHANRLQIWAGLKNAVAEQEKKSNVVESV